MRDIMPPEQFEMELDLFIVGNSMLFYEDLINEYKRLWLRYKALDAELKLVEMEN